MKFPNKCFDINRDIKKKFWHFFAYVQTTKEFLHTIKKFPKVQQECQV